MCHGPALRPRPALCRAPLLGARQPQQSPRLARRQSQRLGQEQQ
ncbi:hypothetical protein [Streptomyces sennicomposti]